jgi:hypothetical protein
MSPQGVIVARYRHHCWTLIREKTSFRRVHCRGSAEVRFEKESGECAHTFGPYTDLYFLDGALCTKNGAIAHFQDSSLLWALDDLDIRCPVLEIEAVE